MPGYIYLVKTSHDVYKVGRTEQESGLFLTRFQEYPKSSVLVYVRKYEGDLSTVETSIMRAFRNEFGQPVRGNEYFRGSENRMLEIIDEYVVDRTVSLKPTDPVTLFIEQRCIKGEGLCVPLKVFFTEFKHFCKDDGFRLPKCTREAFAGLLDVQTDSLIWRGAVFQNQSFVFGYDFRPDPRWD
jgi:hypothetical protein